MVLNGVKLPYTHTNTLISGELGPHAEHHAGALGLHVELHTGALGLQVELHAGVPCWGPGPGGGGVRVDTELQRWHLLRLFTCADSRVGDDGGIGPLVSAGDGVRALMHPIQTSAVEGHQADTAGHLRRRSAAGHRT